MLVYILLIVNTKTSISVSRYINRIKRKKIVRGYSLFFFFDKKSGRIILNVVRLASVVIANIGYMVLVVHLALFICLIEESLTSARLFERKRKRNWTRKINVSGVDLVICLTIAKELQMM